MFIPQFACMFMLMANGLPFEDASEAGQVEVTITTPTSAAVRTTVGPTLVLAPGIGAQTLMLEPLVLGVGDDADGKRGWMGVRLDMPGVPLIKQLNLGNSGLVVTNVCEGSPADQAGLQQYDVIVRFDGREVPHDPGVLAKWIRDSDSGSQISVQLLREATELPVTLMLRARPESEVKWVWKYEPEVNRFFRETWTAHGKLIEPGPGGNVIVWDIDKLEDLPNAFFPLVPPYSEKTVEVWVHDGKPAEKITALQGGITTEIIKVEGGEVEVRRYSPGEDGPVTVEKVYKDLDELNEADPEAYELIQELSGDARAPHAEAPHATWLHLGAPPRPPDVAGSREGERLQKRREFRGALDQHWEQLNNSQVESHIQHLEEHLAQLSETNPWSKEMRDEFRRLAERHLPSPAPAVVQDDQQPRVSIEQEPEGRIRVTVRKGDAELTTIYRDAPHLEEENPRQYERYLQLRSSE